MLLLKGMLTSLPWLLSSRFSYLFCPQDMHLPTGMSVCTVKEIEIYVFWKQWRGKVGQMKQVGKCHLQFIEAQENQSQKGPRRSLVQHPAQSIISSGSCS